MRQRWLTAAHAVALAGCASFGKVTAPAEPYNVGARDPLVGEVSDDRLRKIIAKSELVVLGTVSDRVSEAGLFTPSFQMGTKKTWYSVKVDVDSVARGKLSSAKLVDLGFMPRTMEDRRRFGRLKDNEIVAQYPEMSSPTDRLFAGAPLLTVGEHAVLIFRRCHYCVELTGRPTGRGPYYTANPLVAMTWGSKLPPEEWPRVVRIVDELKHGK
jgi:hypothetical protein